MKKFALILIVVLVTVITVSSCNKKDCPAYSKTGTEQASKNV